MENCRPGSKRIIGFRPELYEHLYETKKNMEAYNTQSEQSVCSDKLIMTDIKSVPSSIHDLSLQNIQ